jgi:hypothetical protein
MPQRVPYAWLKRFNDGALSGKPSREAAHMVRHCRDNLPADVARNLNMPIGSTYADAFRQLAPPPPPARIEVSAEDKAAFVSSIEAGRPDSRLAGRLWGCTDLLPFSACKALGLRRARPSPKRQGGCGQDSCKRRLSTFLLKCAEQALSTELKSWV